jgi:hypothetical protein
MGLVFAVILTTALFGCSDDDPVDPGGGDDPDTTAPQVDTATPPDGALMVPSGQTIEIVLNEPMDPASATGQITLSDGTVNLPSWPSDTTLNVVIADFPEASRVTVTVGTGFKDVAGNSLAAPVDFTYGTWSDNLFIFGTTPAGGAVNVNRAASIELDFGAPMMGETIEAGITISDDTKVLHDFTASSSDQATWLLDPTDPLPANTEITVTIGTSVMSEQETTFESPYSFSFTTGDLVDETPPTIVSIDPPSGSIMPVDKQVITFTFSEPIDPNNFKPRSMNGQLQWLLNQSSSGPSWNPAGDVLTVPLPVDLPAGLLMEAVFADYYDLAGNIQPAETSWSCTLAGTADPYPVADGMRGLMIGEWAEGLPGIEIPTDSGEEWIYTQFTWRPSAGLWNNEDWFDENYTMLDTYEIESVSASSRDIVGFTEEYQGSLTEFFLSDPVTFAEFPFVQGNSWTGEASATLPDGTLDVSLAGEVVGQVDLILGELDGIDIVWTDIWKVEITLEVSAAGRTFSNEITETWYAPGVGVVREKYREDRVEPGEEGWSTSDLWLDLMQRD